MCQRFDTTPFCFVALTTSLTATSHALPYHHHTTASPPHHTLLPIITTSRHHTHITYAPTCPTTRIHIAYTPHATTYATAYISPYPHILIHIPIHTHPTYHHALCNRKSSLCGCTSFFYTASLKDLFLYSLFPYCCSCLRGIVTLQSVPFLYMKNNRYKLAVGVIGNCAVSWFSCCSFYLPLYVLPGQTFESILTTGIA